MSVRKHEPKFECLLLRMQYFESWICTDVTKKENLKLSSSLVTFKSQLFSPFTKLRLYFFAQSNKKEVAQLLNG